VRLRLTVLLWLALAGAAHADSIDDAKRAFGEGVAAFKRGEYEAARRAFRDAEAAHHDPIIVYNLGRAEERLEHPEAAVHAYETYLAEAGERGEYAPAAALAVAQIKARSGRLRIETTPPGARVFVNGQPVEGTSPLTFLVPVGNQVVTVERDAYRATKDVDAQAGKTSIVSFEATVTEADAGASVADAGALVAPDAAVPATADAGPPPKPKEERDPILEGFVGGAAFAFVPYMFLKSRVGPNAFTAGGGQAGAVGEFGYAFTLRAAILVRGVFSFGPECPTFFGAHFAGIGPGVTLRVTHDFWIGGSAIIGNGETCRDGARFSTDFVFSPLIEFKYSVVSKAYGQWLLGLSVGFFFANPQNDNSAGYMPITFGPRFF
jgi:hypothetical protein